MNFVTGYPTSIYYKFDKVFREDGPIVAFRQIKTEALITCVASHALTIGGYFLTNVSVLGAPVGILGAPVLFAGLTATLVSYNIYKLTCNAGQIETYNWQLPLAITATSWGSKVSTAESDKQKLTRGTFGLRSVVEYFISREIVRLSAQKMVDRSDDEDADDDDETVEKGEGATAHGGGEGSAIHGYLSRLQRHSSKDDNSGGDDDVEVIDVLSSRYLGDDDDYDIAGSRAGDDHDIAPSRRQAYLVRDQDESAIEAEARTRGIGVVQDKVTYIANIASVVGYIAVSLLITGLVVARRGAIGTAFGVTGALVGAPALAVAYAIYQLMQVPHLANVIYASMMTEGNPSKFVGMRGSGDIVHSSQITSERFCVAVLPIAMRAARRTFPVITSVVSNIFGFR